jgi:hypothetical protein
MRRRDFIILVGGATSAFSCAKAFAAKTLAQIGILHIGKEREVTESPDLLMLALNALGRREGENCQFEIKR